MQRHVLDKNRIVREGLIKVGSGQFPAIRNGIPVIAVANDELTLGGFELLLTPF